MKPVDKKFWGTVSFLAVAISNINYAQAAEEESAQRMLEEVVVTARKRSESLQDVPLAVSAISAENLQITGATNIGDIQAQVPGLTAYAARGTSNALTAYIRGIGQSDPLYGVEPGVGVYLDDVYIARPQGALLELMDVERVEVLRGPQGTLYGRNTIGGAIKYVSKAPSDEVVNRVQVTGGNYSRRDLLVSTSGPLIENTLYGKAAFLTANRDGYGENTLTGKDVSDKKVMSGNFALQWEGLEDTSVKLAADYTKDRSSPVGGARLLENPVEPTIKALQLSPLLTNTPAGIAGLISTNNLKSEPVSKHRFDTRSGQKDPVNDTLVRGLSVTVDHILNDNFDLKSITAYRKGNTDSTIDFDQGPLAVADVRARYYDEQFTQEFQLNFDNGDDWQAVTGIYYIDGKAGGRGRSHFLTPAPTPLTVPGTSYTLFNLFPQEQGRVDTTSASVYGEGSWQFDEKWGLSFGGRYTWEKKEARITAKNFTDETYTTLVNDIPAAFIYGVGTDFKGDNTWKKFTPKAGLDYELNDDVLLYSSVSQGFKSGGYNIRAQQVLLPRSVKPYDEETVTAYELGFKSTIADRYTLNAAYFYSDYKDIQLSVFTKLPNGRFFGDVRNAGKAVIQGLELEFAAPVTNELTLTGNAAYIDAEYKEYLTDDGTNVASDKNFTNTPKWTATVNATYDYALGDHGDLLAYIGYSFRDEVIPTTDESKHLTQGAYSLVDASLTYTTLDQKWRISLEGRNLTDKEYITSGYDVQAGQSHIVEAFYGAPRTYALKVGYEF